MDEALLRAANALVAHPAVASLALAFSSRWILVVVGLPLLALLLRRRVAVPLFLLSLLAVIVQFGYTFLHTDLLAVKGAGAAIFPTVIVLIGIGQWLYARSQAAKGLLR